MSGPPPHIQEDTMSTTVAKTGQVKILDSSYLLFAKSPKYRSVHIRGILADVSGFGPIVRWAVRGRHGDELHGYAKPHSEDAYRRVLEWNFDHKALGIPPGEPDVLAFPDDELQAMDQEL